MWCTSWSWSYGRYSSWIYNYLYNQFISPLKCHGAVYTIQHYVIKVCPWLVTGGWFFRLLHLLKWQSRYNWYTVESCVRHDKPTNQPRHSCHSEPNFPTNISCWSALMPEAVRVPVWKHSLLIIIWNKRK